MTRKSKREIERELDEMDTERDDPTEVRIVAKRVDENGEVVETIKDDAYRL